jgi:hypothetical protein
MASAFRDRATNRAIVEPSVDDNLDAVHSMAMVLRVMGHDVQFAINRFAAVDVTKSFRPDGNAPKASERRWLSLLRRATHNDGISGKLEADAAAFAGLTFCPDAPAMCFHDAPRDVKAEAQASAVVLADLPESLENGGQAILGYARAGVATQKRSSLRRARHEGDFAARVI